MAGDLDKWFEFAQKNIDDDWDTWKDRAAREGPSVWRRASNPITRALAETLCQDECILPDTSDPGYKQVRSVSAGLLDAYRGDLDLIKRALERCRKNPKWRDLNLYVKRKNIEIQIAKLRALAHRTSWADVAEEEERKVATLIECPRCHKLIYPEHEDLPCLMH